MPRRDQSTLRHSGDPSLHSGPQAPLFAHLPVCRISLRFPNVHFFWIPMQHARGTVFPYYVSGSGENGGRKTAEEAPEGAGPMPAPRGVGQVPGPASSPTPSKEEL